MPTDLELLRQFAEQGDDAAFTEVVRRHTDFVYSTAWRVTNEAALAEDVTQKVFLKMAERAGVLGHYTTLIGWLHTTTRHIALDAVRGEARRRTREQEASAMQNNPATHEPDWAELRPILDEAVGRLAESDRTAVLLRFFNGLSHRDVGVTLGLSEDATRKRIDRSLEKMRGYFARHGVTVSSALLAASITTNSVQAAPVGLAAQAARKSLAGKVAGATAGATGAIIFLKFLFMNTKNKIILGAILVVLIAIGLAISSGFNSPSPSPTSVTSATAAPKPAVATPAIAPAPIASPLPPVTSASKPAHVVDAGIPANKPVTSANAEGDNPQQALIQISQAYMAYADKPAKRSFGLQPGQSVHAAAILLARKTFLNDAWIYFIPGDPAAPTPLPNAVMLTDEPVDPKNPDASMQVNPAFTSATLSVEMVGNMPPNAPSTTTPFAWTRGLRDDGTWAPDSPFHGQGGFVAFLDGHVEYYTSLSIGANGTCFVGYPNSSKAGQPTVNIHEALPPDVVILSAEPSGKSN